MKCISTELVLKKRDQIYIANLISNYSIYKIVLTH